ncbi:MAG: hypothetical protein Q8R87_11975 [Anaerolineaceae bacterium]|jgi:uncharacterized membrane protein YgaE (UPF0421/DUF939 family)|nr:hypothetical protein [Anaerolineaceae bacterium]MDP3451290.1 hypothetical protein [Anaerolineaceae bacterium]
MKKYLSIFENMNAVDWLLAVVITALLAYAVNMVFPPNGWLMGIVAALLLLFLAKRRRDRLTKG